MGAALLAVPARAVTLSAARARRVLPFLAPHPLRLRRAAPSVSPRRRAAARAAADAAAAAAPGQTPAGTLVVVESPAKAATIQAILPEPAYRVRSCVGHIREIPSSAKRIPARYKALPWARLGVDITRDFRPIYVLIAGKQAVLRDLRAELARSAQLVLATDDDREGEAISWHLSEVLKPTVPVSRAVFHEITPDAIHHAFANCRPIDLNLVEAQETRRVLDRLAGYTMSPLLWKKIARGLSAGRVQSVAMSVVVHREMARLRFTPARYFAALAHFRAGPAPLAATLSAVDGVRIVKGPDFLDDTGQLSALARERRFWHFDRPAIQHFCDRIDRRRATVSAVERRHTTRNPPPPLITSTLQQECGNKLGMGAGRTMRVAQKLYESGFITYMRTDNPALSDQAVNACRAAVQRHYGKDSLWDGQGGPRGAKPKAAQAAHEAVRPAGTVFLTPDELRQQEGLDDEQVAVYGIIFRRTLASQMASAKLAQTTIKIQVPLSGDGEGSVAEFKATGSVIVEPGFLRVYQGEDAQGKSTFLPAVAEGDNLDISDISVLEHETKPPPRYNDASLVKELEELGVGRPSTYAGIIEKLITRGYLHRGRALPEEKRVPPKALVPSLTAFAVESLLSKHFPSFVDAEFTARMEEALDEIAAGSAERANYLQQYYCGDDGLAASVERTEKEIDASSFRRILLPNMPKAMHEDAEWESKSSKNGAPKKSPKVSKRPKPKQRAAEVDESPAAEADVDWSSTRVLVSSYGPYVEQGGSVVASLPKTTLADDLSEDRLATVLQIAKDPVLGTDPRTGMPLLLKTSRYGPYVQLGRDEDAPEGTKPKRCGLFPGMDVGTLTVDLASKLLSLPRLLGEHPTTGQEVRAAMGPYGPYVVHEGTYVSLRRDEHDVLEIGLSEALKLIDAAEQRKQVRLAKQAEKKQEARGAKAKSNREDVSTKKSNGTVKRTTKRAGATAKTVA